MLRGVSDLKLKDKDKEKVRKLKIPDRLECFGL